MAKKGLTKESVLDAAETIVQEGGIHRLTTAALAEKLGVKPASLYNHINSTDEVISALGLRTIHALAEALTAATRTRHREEALYALAEAYRQFIRQYPHRYHLILRVPLSGDNTLTAVLSDIISPIIAGLSDFSLTEEQRQHWQRALRSTMHGFSMLELCGYFSHSTTDREESYRTAISAVVLGILSAEEQNRTQTTHPKEEPFP